ncbi:MAG TPA: hypothetical protein VNW71_04430 [Thermoanaerobaculia bacterium]|nr:hypothetical protein [Thermoanaerobaculia bacterium]
MKRITLTLAGFVALGLIASAVWAAPQREMVVGSEGEIYAVRTGIYGELFPGGKETAATDPVLALDVTRPDGTSERLLVNGTGGPEVESLPFLLFEESSKALFLVWEARVSLIHPILMLSGYNGDWIEPFEILSNPFSMKSSPQFAVTQDTYQEQGPEGPVSRHRTTFHMVWGEETENDLIETFYTPIFLENGRFVGRSPIYKLNDIEPKSPENRPVASALAQNIRVQRGRDERTVVVAFVSPASGRLNTLEIDALPMQLSLLADGARAHIIDLGARLYPGKLKNLAEEARAHIIDLGRSFHPVVSNSLAAQAQTYISGSSPSRPLKSIADGARAHIIDLGAKLSGRGLKNAAGAATSSSIIEVPTNSLLANADASFSPQLLQIQMISARPIPEVGEGSIKMFVSEKGQDVLLAWINEQRVLYVETLEAGWSDVREIRLTEDLDSARALKMLEQRVLNR